MTVLGAAVGTDEFAAAQGTEAAAEEQALLDRICALPELQHAWLLLSYCAAPRANYRLRTAPPAQTAAYAADHDQRVLAAVCCLLAVAGLDEAQARQLRLPLRLGGLGLRSASRTAPAAFGPA